MYPLAAKPEVLFTRMVAVELVSAFDSHVVAVGRLPNSAVASPATSAILTDTPCASSVARTRSARWLILTPSTESPTTRRRPSAAVVAMPG